MREIVVVVYLECAVVSLQFPAQALQLAAGQDGLAVFVPQVVFLLDELILLLLQHPHLLLGVPVLFQLSHTHTHVPDVILLWVFPPLFPICSQYHHYKPIFIYQLKHRQI